MKPLKYKVIITDQEYLQNFPFAKALRYLFNQGWLIVSDGNTESKKTYITLTKEVPYKKRKGSKTRMILLPNFYDFPPSYSYTKYHAESFLKNISFIEGRHQLKIVRDINKTPEY